MPKLDLHQPQRQAPLGVAIMFVQNLRRAISFFLAVILVNFGGNFKYLGMSYQEWGILMAVFFLIYSILQYQKFFFYVSGDHFVIERGVLKQEKINVPFGRIQSVNTTQNILQRILNLVGLKIDTAGSVQQEINIPALSRDYAQALRDFLMEKRYEHEKDPSEASPTAESIPKQQRSPLLRLSIADLFKVGFTQNHLRSGLVLFAIVNGYVWEFEEYLIKPFEPYLEETAETFVGKGFILFPIALLAFAVISVITSLISTILRYYDFRFYLGSEGLDIESGLLSRNSFNVPYEKIQYFIWESNPLRRLIGYRTLKVKQAGTQALNERKLIGIPGLKSKALLRVIHTMYPDRKTSVYTYYSPHRLLFIQRTLWLVLLPSTILAGLIFYQGLEFWFYLPLLLMLVFGVWLSYHYWLSVKLRVNASYLEIRRGFVFPKRLLIPNFKLQNLSINQSFLQRWRGLSTIHFHTAAGTIRVSHLPEKESLALYNYLLFCIESRSDKWM